MEKNDTFRFMHTEVVGVYKIARTHTWTGQADFAPLMLQLVPARGP